MAHEPATARYNGCTGDIDAVTGKMVSNRTEASADPGVWSIGLAVTVAGTLQLCEGAFAQSPQPSMFAVEFGEALGVVAVLASAQSPRQPPRPGTTKPRIIIRFGAFAWPNPEHPVGFKPTTPALQEWQG